MDIILHPWEDFSLFTLCRSCVSVSGRHLNDIFHLNPEKEVGQGDPEGCLWLRFWARAPKGSCGTFLYPPSYSQPKAQLPSYPGIMTFLLHGYQNILSFMNGGSNTGDVWVFKFLFVFLVVYKSIIRYKMFSFYGSVWEPLAYKDSGVRRSSARGVFGSITLELPRRAWLLRSSGAIVGPYSTSKLLPPPECQSLL